MSESGAGKHFSLTPIDFGDDFVWGVSTAAYQIEGGHNAHDKGKSIWDTFVTKKGAVFQGQHGEQACDFFNGYKEDILLMKSMNLKNYRFSLSWPRLTPNGHGEVSSHGIDFYNRVINFCLECGITPWVTLYHWDLPQVLEDKGGWTNRNIVPWFQDYVAVCARAFGDRVRHWMVLNEPMVFTGAGYFLGVHAPGRKGLKHFLPAVHHAVLCQAAGGKTLRSLLPHAIIGTTISCSHITPYSNNKKNGKAAEKVDALLNRLFLEPSLGMGYPLDSIPSLKGIEKYQRPGDIENSRFEFDFIGIQNYTREVVKHSYFVPFLRAKIVKATKRKVQTTLMDWEVYPPSIYHMIRQYNRYQGVKKILVTENGAAFTDVPQNNAVHDPERLEYLQNYIQQVHRAKKEGYKIDGYFAWTFTDNFEWAEGYFPRFGLVYVDFPTQKRTIKSSGKWFKGFLGTTI